MNFKINKKYLCHQKKHTFYLSHRGKPQKISVKKLMMAKNGLILKFALKLQNWARRVLKGIDPKYGLKMDFKINKKHLCHQKKHTFYLSHRSKPQHISVKKLMMGIGPEGF